MDPKTTNYVVVGGGKMGGALISGWLKQGQIEPGRLTVVEPATETAAGLEKLGCRVVGQAADAPTADIYVIAVKPQIFAQVVSPLAATLADKVVISIAAGLDLERLRGYAPKARWVRAMPNQPVTVGRGATGLYTGDDVDAEQRDHVLALFAAVGSAQWVADEALMHAVTGVSGSGPAYVALFAEAMEDAGVNAGLPRATARQLALATLAGAAEQMAAGMPPAELKAAVTSPGGTTIAGIRALEQSGLRGAVMAGIDASIARSQELSD